MISDQTYLKTAPTARRELLRRLAPYMRTAPLPKVVHNYKKLLMLFLERGLRLL